VKPRILQANFGESIKFKSLSDGF